MPRRSIAAISPEELRTWEHQLFEVISNLKSHQLASFLREFLTDEEVVMLSKRFQLYSLLYNNMPLKEVQQTLGVSRETTRFYSHLKDEKGTEFKSIVVKAKNQTRKKTEETSKVANFMDLAIKSRSNPQARAKLLQGDLE